jgi:hypothetical protein
VATDPALSGTAARLRRRHHRFAVVRRGGYESAEHVLNIVDILDMAAARWVARWPTPPKMAQTHAAFACDGERFIYFVSGQLGNHCRAATDSAFALDTSTTQFHDLPPLPRRATRPRRNSGTGGFMLFAGHRKIDTRRQPIIGALPSATAGRSIVNGESNRRYQSAVRIAPAPSSTAGSSCSAAKSATG